VTPRLALSLVAVLMMAAAPADPPTAQTEMLGINVPDDFQIGYQARNAEIHMIEVVQPPETVDNWSKLITLQLFFDGTRHATAREFWARWLNGMHRACAGMTENSQTGTVDGRPAIKGSLSCPLNPQTGKLENLVAVLVQGEVNLMMVQVAFRHPIGPADRLLIDRVVNSLKVCDERTLAACSARKPNGFIASRG